MKNRLLLLLSFLFISLTTPSCFVVVHPDGKDVAPEIKMSPKPEIAMSDKIVRSTQGDMIASLPQNWFFVDLNSKLGEDVFATAVNSDYNLAAVFSTIPASEELDNAVKKEGLVALARINLERRNNKAGSNVQLSGKYQLLSAGTLKYATYNYTISGAINAKSAVFKSQLGIYYEFSLVPMIVNGNLVPPQDEIDMIFESILATLKY